MAVYSKLLTPMSVPCEHYVHPWTSSCYQASAGLFLHALQASFRLYVTVYLLALLMKGRKPSAKDIRNTFYGILQSTAFIGCHAVGFSLCACFMRNTLGHYNFFTFAFLPTFVSSWFAILVERPSRRGLLSLYVTNIASETLYYMLVWRGLVKPVPLADIFLFTTSISWLLYLYRAQHDNRDALFSLVRFIVGPYEQLNYDKQMDSPEQELDMEELDENLRKHLPGASFRKPVTPKTGRSRRASGLIYRSVLFMCRLYKRLIQNAKLLAISQHCPHPHGCLYYWIMGGLRVFAVGYGLQFCLKLLLQIKRIVKRPTIILKCLKSPDTFKLGAFIGGFSFIYRMVSCILRQWLQQDSQYIAIPAAFLAGFSFCFYRSNTIALYVMWKSLQILYMVGLENNVVPEVPHASIIFHCLSTAILFQAAIFEPQNLRSSYWNFLHNMSGGRIGMMDRKCLDIYGLQSNQMLESVINRYTSRPKKDFHL